MPRQYKKGKAANAQAGKYHVADPSLGYKLGLTREENNTSSWTEVVNHGNCVTYDSIPAIYFRESSSLPVNQQFLNQ